MWSLMRSPMFEEREPVKQKASYLAVLGLPFVYTSLQEHQKKYPFCVHLLKKCKIVLQPTKDFGLIRGSFVRLYLRRIGLRHYIPPELRMMLLKHFHDSPLSGSVGALKPLKEIADNIL
jgi:hypothetical protein